MSKTKKMQLLLRQKKFVKPTFTKPTEPQSAPRTQTTTDINEYFEINTQLQPPYNIILDTSFINTAIKRKLDIPSNMTKCLLANCNLYITDCVIAELEKLGNIFRIGLALVKNTSIYKRLTCDHAGCYADDCLVDRVQVDRCYFVATCDTELKVRLRRVPGVPIVSLRGKFFDVERLPRAVIKKL